MITIKNYKGEICDYRIPYCVDVKGEVECIKRLIEECRREFDKTNMFPRGRLNT